MGPLNLVRAFYEELWNRKNISLIPHVLDKQLILRGSLGDKHEGHSGFKNYLAFIHSRLHEYHCEILETTCESDKAFARMKFSGIHVGELVGYSATNMPIYWEAAARFKFNVGRIKDVWVLGDIYGLQKRLDSNQCAYNTYKVPPGQEK